MEVNMKKRFFLIFLAILFLLACNKPVQRRIEFFRDINPKDAPTGPDTVIEFEMSESEFYNWHGLLAGKEDLDYERAIWNFSEAIELDPLYATAYGNRGIAYSKLGNYEKAIEDYNKAIELYPGYAKAYFNRGFTYSKLQEYKKALDDYNQAIKLNPENANAYVLRGVVYSNLGDIESACADQKKACELGLCEGLEIARQKGLCK